MRYKSALAAVGLLASSLVLTQPAEAAVPAAAQQSTATCSLVVPARISIRAQLNNFVGALGSNCSASVYTAVWKSTPNATTYPQGRLEFLYGNRQSGFTIIGSAPPIGTVAWTPAGGATNPDGVKIADLASTTSVVRCASVAALTGGRKGTKTALVTTVSYYRPLSNGFVRWANQKVLVQYQEVGSSTWKGLAYVTTNSKGQAAYTYYPGKTRRYRVYVAGTGSVWNVFSATISR